MKALLLVINIVSLFFLVSAVYNGEPTWIDQYPWLAFIEYDIYETFCTGSLINNRWVITAATCIVTTSNIDKKAKSVRLGEHDLSNDGRDCVEAARGREYCNDGTKTFDIIEKIAHPEYYTNKDVFNSNDIALIKLNDTVIYSDFIQPIYLPRIDITRLPALNQRFTIAGWGVFNKSLIRSDVKLQTELPYVDLITCRKQIVPNNIWYKQICAGGENGKDSCSGDVGGPLMYPHGDTYELTGIISFGAKKCGFPGKPTVCTKVYDYITWITDNVDDSESPCTSCVKFV